MDSDDYKMTQEMLLMLARQVRLLDLSAFLQAIDRAETLGPILDPTLYRASLYDGNLERIKELARGALGSWRGRDDEVELKLNYVLSGDLWCLGQTKDGHPKHPLYLKANTPLVKWEGR